MNVITGEVISSGLINFGYSEVALTALMLKVLHEGDFVVDVGTHFGYEALLAAELVGKNGLVVCFEPHPETFKIACKNLAESNIEVNNMAVGSADGYIKMANNDITRSAFNSIDTALGDSASIDVPIVSLDSFFKERKSKISFIKCDVEGFEMEVLKGAINVIEQDKPIMVLEAEMPLENPERTRAKQLAAFLKVYNYKPFNFGLQGQYLEIAELDRSQSDHANVLFIHESMVLAVKQQIF
jgi:FkbM family methyltransferase